MLLCELVEDGIVKCECYWPQDLGVIRRYGDVNVILVHVESFANFVVRTFHIAHCDSGDQHVVTQYQFTAWPEHGVPRDPLALLDFHYKVSLSG